MVIVITLRLLLQLIFGCVCVRFKRGLLQSLRNQVETVGSIRKVGEVPQFRDVLEYVNISSKGEAHSSIECAQSF